MDKFETITPLNFEIESGGIISIQDKCGNHVGNVFDNVDLASAFVAAPELLQACQIAIVSMQYRYARNPTDELAYDLQIVGAAILKAGGKLP